MSLRSLAFVDSMVTMHRDDGRVSHDPALKSSGKVVYLGENSISQFELSRFCRGRHLGSALRSPAIAEIVSGLAAAVVGEQPPFSRLSPAARSDGRLSCL